VRNACVRIYSEYDRLNSDNISRTAQRGATAVETSQQDLQPLDDLLRLPQPHRCRQEPQQVSQAYPSTSAPWISGGTPSHPVFDNPLVQSGILGTTNVCDCVIEIQHQECRGTYFFSFEKGSMGLTTEIR